MSHIFHIISVDSCPVINLHRMPDPEFTISEIKGLVGKYMFCFVCLFLQKYAFKVVHQRPKSIKCIVKLL